jgi:hypothetical protein
MLMIEMLARMPDLRRRLQTEHIADAGGRCQDCPGTAWPCELYRMATEADRRHGTGPGAGLPPTSWGARPPERGESSLLGRGLPRQNMAGTVPAPASPVWMSGPPARLAPVPPAPSSRWGGSAGPAGVGARLGAVGAPGGPTDGPTGHALPGTELPTPRTTIGAFPVVPAVSGPPGAQPGSPAPASPGTALSLRHDEVRARHERHLARRDERRARRDELERRRDGGRHDLGWPSRHRPAPPGHVPRPHGELIDVLEEVLRWSH